MNFPEAIALCAFVIGAIVLAGIVLEAYNSRLRARTKELELKVRLTKAEGIARAPRIDEMEDRLRVLERIATDRAPDLAAQIDDLRTPLPKLENSQ